MNPAQTHVLAESDTYVGLPAYEHRRAKFVVEYLKDRDGARAYLASGFHSKDRNSAASAASRLLRDPEVSRAIREHDLAELDAVQKQTRVTLARTVARLGAIAFADPRQLFDEDGKPRPVDQIPEDLAAAIAGLDVEQRIDEDGTVIRTTKYRLLDKNRTLDMLMKHLNGYAEHQKAVADPLLRLLGSMKRSALPVVQEVEDARIVGGSAPGADAPGRDGAA